MEIVSSSPKSTKKFAADFAKKILKNKKFKNKSALVIGLVGDLGTGKTTFIQSFARALGIKQNLPSPTFVIMRSYRLSKQLPITNYQLLRHIDAYRIKKAAELDTLDFKSILQNPENIVLIEWAEKMKKILPKETIWINFEHGEKENERIMKIPEF